MRTQLLTIALSPEAYKRLEQLALSEDRDPIQQARHMLRRVLEPADQPNEPIREPVLAGRE